MSKYLQITGCLQINLLKLNSNVKFNICLLDVSMAFDTIDHYHRSTMQSIMVC